MKGRTDIFVSVLTLSAIFWWQIGFVNGIRNEGLLANMAWMEWPTLKSHTPQPMNQNYVFDAIKALRGLDDPYINDNLHRVDRYIINNYGEEFMFAWTKTVCHAVNHSSWRESNGHDFATLLAADLHRLRHMHILRDDKTVAIDIGAHVGDSTIPMAFLAQKTIAFEPGNHSFSFLRANAALNPHLNISMHRLAIGPANSEAIVKYGGADKSVDVECNAIIKRIIDDGTTTISSRNEVRVNMVRLEDFLIKQYGDDIVKSIGFIKIDASGFDGIILNSIHSLLNRIGKLPILQVDYWFGKSMTDLDNGSKELFTAIASLPGPYNAFCVVKCPNIENFAFSKCPFRIRQLHFTLQKGESGENQKIVTGVSFNTQSEANSDVMCEDLVLYPAGFSHLPQTV